MSVSFLLGMPVYVFDLEQAIENNENEEVIEIGMFYNEMLRYEQKRQWNSSCGADLVRNIANNFS